MDRVLGPARIAIGLVIMALGVAVFIVAALLLLPWRRLRIRLGNVFGKTICRTMVWLSGCPLTLRGTEHLDPSRPAIYVSNHTSVLDIFIGSWLAPWGTVGIAKKEIVWYPFFGQLYLLSGHLRLDRGKRDRAVASLGSLSDLVCRHGLSIFMWPEGTRSRDGRLLPLKKGIAHLALQTGLPIVPIVVAGAHRAWEKRTLRVRAVPIDVTVLPAMSTAHWTAEDIDKNLAELHARFAEALPEEQRPLRQAA